MAYPTVDRDIVSGLVFFSELSNDEIDVVVPICQAIEGGAGQYLTREGEKVRNLYILLSGEVSVLKNRADGTQALVATVGKGEVIGEMSFLHTAPAAATVRATGPFTALALDQDDLQKLLLTNLAVSAKLYKRLALVSSRRLSALLRQH